ncbi:Uncharacterized beta-barrel protein YwiB, DUF1934 family [Lachnospiraceae bacterium XBB1006]|nr:Uncharacterized beta-barrel protein YwiB, DUF1934 family [Lachnospiraceae bacterium XBB1006]
MPEKILFHVDSSHTIADGKKHTPDKIEMINVADYHYKDSVHYIHYEEIVEGTEELTENLVKIGNNRVEIIKKGAVRSHLIFENGKANESVYYIPEGQIQMAVDTKQVEIVHNPQELTVRLQYAMIMNYQKVADCDLTMVAKLQKEKI